jgi:capsular polysaccharide biosynthesis protein
MGGNYLIRVATGSFAGLAVGLVIAFGREFLSRKIRYKRDIEDELGLKVVGVIPQN